MSSSIIGAQSVDKQERQEYTCIIRKIECLYTSEEEEKTAVFFDRDEMEQKSLSKSRSMEDRDATNSKLVGGISNNPDYYFITNHKGKDVELKCEREVNSCKVEKHHQYDIDYIDIESRELQTEVKEITDGKRKLYYFNIFNRTAEYAKTGFTKGAKIGMSAGSVVGEVSGAAFGGVADAFISGDPNERRGSDIGRTLGQPIGAGLGTVGGAGLGSAGGAAVGHLADLISSLRFIILPFINKSDEKYACFTTLAYRECPNRFNVPTITIYTYPDIEFEVKIGFKGHSHDYYADSAKKDTSKDTSFSIEFTSTYADTEKQLSLEKVDEKELDAEAQKGTGFYNALVSIAEFFKAAAQFAQKLRGLIETVDSNKIDTKKIAKDVGFVGNTFGNVGKSLSKTSDWLKGSLEIDPSLTIKWRYSVNDELTKIGRHIEAELGIDCTGKLTIDLIQIAIQFFNKTKKVTTVAAAATSVASGGLAAIPSFLIKFLVDAVVSWLVEQFKKGIKFDLILSAGANLKAPPITLDTSSDKVVTIDGVIVEIKPEIKLVAALEYKTSVTLILSTKAEGEMKASAEAASSLTWKMELNIANGYLGVDNNVTINPFSFKLEYKVAGSFEIFGCSLGSSHNSKVKEWKAKKIEMDPMRWNWLKLYDNPAGGFGGGKSGGGGGGGSWNGR